MKDQETEVVLNGGLGNQFFQLAAGLFKSGQNNLILRSELGNPRKSSKGKIQIEHFELPSNVQISSLLSENILIRKFLNYSVRKSGKVSSRRLHFFLEFFISVIMSVLKLKFCRIVISNGIGFDKRFHSTRVKALLVGYFQCWQYASNPFVFDKMMKIRPATFSGRLNVLIDEISRVKPIILHIRLGDYKLENSFGIPDVEYIKKSLIQLNSSLGVRSIWVFSDEPEEAIAIVKLSGIQDYRLMEEVDGSPEQTFELMRHGSGYVIANSTFSWWAAFLRYDRSSPVCMPQPWFKSQEDPEGIFPPGWHTELSWRELC